MSERYEKQFEFINAIYSPDCPVALEKGAVLLDTKTNTYMLQLKLANIGTKSILSARVHIDAYDREENTIYTGVTQGIAADYEELIGVGDAFGTKKLLPLPNNNAAIFYVFVEKITTTDRLEYTFAREQYIVSESDIAAKRERAFKKEQIKQAWREKTYKKMWGAKWYHVIFAISVLMSFSTPIIGGSVLHSGAVIGVFLLIPLLLSLFFWIFTWTSIGTPRIKKRSFMTAIFISLSHFLLSAITVGLLGALIILLIVSLVSFIPFTLISINVRVQKSKQKRGIKKELALFSPSVYAEAPVISEIPTIIEVNTAIFCSNCREQAEQGAKFCKNCGGALSE
jgi:protein-S-isoprenylcysteine O-methyltransferase Ste14